MKYELSRRNVLRAAGGAVVAAAVAPALVACGGSKSSSSGGAQSNAGKTLAPWPTYTPVKGLNPELPGTAAGVQDTFLAYPRSLVESVPAKPGDGSKVTAMIVTYGAPPKGPDQNKLWKAVNDAVGVDVELTMVSDKDYVAKYSTMMASGDLPDIMMLGLQPLPNEALFLQSKCADLTGYLSGDMGAKDYPNLAAIPHYAWDAMGRVGGRIFAVPLQRALMGNSFFANRDLLQQNGIWNDSPGRIKKDELTAGLVKLNTNSHFALGSSVTAHFGYLNHAGTHGAPNIWSQANGVFTSTYASEEFKNTIATMADWYSKGLYDPATLSTSTTQAKTDFQNGTYITDTDGFGAYGGFATTIGDAWKGDFVRPFDAGTKATPWYASGYFGYTAIKASSPERVKMLLAVLNFFAAPFGSKEYELINYGIEGVHFTRGADGGPSVPTALGKVENKTNLPFAYIAAGAAVNYIPGYPEWAKRSYAAQQAIIPIGIRDPSLGIRSATRDKQWPTLQQMITDGIDNIVSGKAKLSDWDDVVKKWRSSGGDTVAQELAAEYAKLHA